MALGRGGRKPAEASGYRENADGSLSSALVGIIGCFLSLCPGSFGGAGEEAELLALWGWKVEVSFWQPKEDDLRSKERLWDIFSLISCSSFCCCPIRATKFMRIDQGLAKISVRWKVEVSFWQCKEDDLWSKERLWDIFSLISCSSCCCWPIIATKSTRIDQGPFVLVLQTSWATKFNLELLHA